MSKIFNFYSQTTDLFEEFSKNESETDKKETKEPVDNNQKYRDFFKKVLKKFKVKSPNELEDSKKSEFFNYIDDNFESEPEKKEASDKNSDSKKDQESDEKESEVDQKERDEAAAESTKENDKLERERSEARKRQQEKDEMKKSEEKEKRRAKVEESNLQEKKTTIPKSIVDRAKNMAAKEKEEMYIVRSDGRFSKEGYEILGKRAVDREGIENQIAAIAWSNSDIELFESTVYDNTGGGDTPPAEVVDELDNIPGDNNYVKNLMDYLSRNFKMGEKFAQSRYNFAPTRLTEVKEYDNGTETVEAIICEDVCYIQGHRWYKKFFNEEQLNEFLDTYRFKLLNERSKSSLNPAELKYKGWMMDELSEITGNHNIREDEIPDSTIKKYHKLGYDPEDAANKFLGLKEAISMSTDAKALQRTLDGMKKDLSKATSPQIQKGLTNAIKSIEKNLHALEGNKEILVREGMSNLDAALQHMQDDIDAFEKLISTKTNMQTDVELKKNLQSQVKTLKKNLIRYKKIKTKMMLDRQ